MDTVRKKCMSRNQLTSFNISLHLFVLSSLAFSQPIFDILAKNTGFFVAHNSQYVDILLLTVAVVLVIPCGLSMVVYLSSLISHRFKKIMISIIITALLSFIFLQISGDFIQVSGFILIALSVMLAAVVTAIYLKVSWLKSYLTTLSPIIIVFPMLFLYFSPVSELFEINPIKKTKGVTELASTPPIVMVVFDELPLTSLMDEQRKIDSTLYPNFSLLASRAHWFRNATTVSAFTDTAVPAILTGNYPVHNSAVHPAATITNYPNNLFSLLNGTYDIVAYEAITKLNSSTRVSQEVSANKMYLLFADLSAIYLHILLPTDLTKSLPQLTGRWLNFWGFPVIEKGTGKLGKYKGHRPGTVTKYLDSINVTNKPTLYFLHIELPHVRYEYLPSGKRYGPVSFIPHGMGKDKWSFDEWEVVQGYQRHLLQVGFVDRILGDIIDRLKDVGIFENALMVVTADHGQSFIKGTPPRAITDANYQDILPVPLLIKVPNQKNKFISDKNIESIDILPSVTGVLGIDLPWKIDGRSVFDSTSDRTNKIAIGYDGKRLIFDPIIEKKYETLERKIKIFGSHDRKSIFKIGDYIELLNQKATPLTTKYKSRIKVFLDNDTKYKKTSKEGGFIQAFIRGNVILDENSMTPVHLAVGVNGSIEAVTKTHVGSDGNIGFTAMIPERSLKHRENNIELFEVTLLNNEIRLNAIVPGISSITNQQLTSAPNYTWNSELIFGSGGNAVKYQQEGWSKPDRGITWTNGSRATIILNVLPLPDSPVDLNINASAFLVDKVLDAQIVRVFINGNYSGAWDITESGFHQHTITIAPDLFVESGIQVITFEIPTSAIPADLGVNEDKRTLGLAFSSFYWGNRPNIFVFNCYTHNSRVLG